MPHRLSRVTLEMSLKPFLSMEPEAIRAVCRTALNQWYPLCKSADSASVLLWVADGSEILEWSGNMAQRIEWARFIGFCNSEYDIYAHSHETRSERVAKPYVHSPVEITYGDLRLIVATLNDVAKSELGLDFSVGATFDPGPEFAPSPFKYDRHSEIIGGGRASAVGASFPMVDAAAVLHADESTYAAFPAGIDEATSFGTFLGRQAREFLEALGFDYLWLSNGFGFSHFAWSCLGVNFNGHEFGISSADEAATRALSYWRDFSAACPGCSIEVRGTNFSMAMDLADDLVPYRDIYDGGYLRTPPPNSPWGPLNNDYGLEIIGYMSRVAVLPGETYPFRFYPNDPWFWQNPWWDRYDREPFDVYCPLSVSRVRSDGAIQPPGIVEFLTIDTEHGVLDERCPLEVIPHIRRAVEDAPDQPGLLTWVYPFDEYHEIVAVQPEVVFFGDWFMRAAVNAGLPLNTVVSTREVGGASASGVLSDSVLICPTAIGANAAEAVSNHLERGGRALFYGPIANASPEVRSLLPLGIARGIEGRLSLDTNLRWDSLELGEFPKAVNHDPLVSAGPIRAVATDTCELHAEVRSGSERRVYAVSARVGAGRVAWIRGTNAFSTAPTPESPLRVPRPHASELLDPGVLVRMLLGELGYVICHRRRSREAPSEITFLSRNRGAWILSGYKAETTGSLRLRFPAGAPLLVGWDTEIVDGMSEYHLPRAPHEEIRILVDQRDGGLVSCKEYDPFPTGMERTLIVSGLEEATVTVLVPPSRIDRLLLRCSDGESVPSLDGSQATIDGVNGRLTVAW